MPTARNSTVNRKPKPQSTTKNPNKRLSRTILEARFGDEYSNLEVIIRIIVVTASHKLISATLKGKFILSL
jgi:hypothetical protein